MKFILVPIGSAGDVHPFIWLGRLLAARGHDVVILAQEVVRSMPEAAGLRVIGWGDLAEQESILRNPDIWHPTRALELLIKYIPTWAQQSMALMRREAASAPDETVIVAGALAFGARVVAERWGLPLITMHLQPTALMSAQELPVMMAGTEWVGGMPLWFRRAFVALGNWRVDRLLGPLVNQVRHSVGLTGNITGLMRQYWNSPDGVLCMFPEWFARKAADWPRQAMVTRFPLYDESTDRPLDEKLEHFMASGDAPIVITPGSANAFAAPFIENAVAACALLKRRALVVTRFPEQVGKLPEGSAAFEYVPFGRIFSRAAAVVHHGGVGTTAQCFAGNVPQFLMPMAHDQPDNALRVKKLGVGDYLYPKKFKPRRIAEKLGKLLENEQVKRACVECQRRIGEQMSEGEMGEIVERMGQRALGRREAEMAMVK